MKIDTLVLGAYQTNSYILRKTDTDTDCLIIDTSLNTTDLPAFLHENNLNPAALILTHAHVDHIAGVPSLRKDFPDIKVYVHKLDASMLTNPQANLSEFAAIPLSIEPAEFLVDESDIIEAAGIKLQVIHTPGHTPGGICLYSKDANVLFSGDTLFADSVGRTDFPGGDMNQLIDGIKQKLSILPDNTEVYPGHGPATTMGQEKAYNQYLR